MTKRPHIKRSAADAVVPRQAREADCTCGKEHSLAAQAKLDEALPSLGRIGRNEPCLCGSGQKWKRCCGGKKRGVPRPKKPTCVHENPVEGYGYVGAGDEADRLRALGWRQEYCRECGLWAIWVDPKKSVAGRASLIYVDGLHLTDEAEKIAAFDAFTAGWVAAIADEVGGS